MLELRDVSTGYGAAQVLRDVSLDVQAGEIHCLLGRNGAGKTTTMKAIAGLLPVWSGTIHLDGAEIGALPAHRVGRTGVGYIPQGRRLFGELTVAQNLEIGLMTRRSAPAVRERALDLFPRLRERMSQRAQTLSGGEQQMLATARALCTEPKVLLLDEPTEGLQPSMIAAIRDVIVRLRGEGTAILLVEQRIDAVLAVADRVTFLENGQTRETWDAADLRADHSAIDRYLGV
ncbi:ABC transporter ATP-binding protein [Psychromarinibacter halotolerans]|uniref:ABC transporter ATP-binding protein n=1 Tax=Psychromarinibacter halotolerans TaxID=1775175 RepID=A0ABV7GK74_9RHOB|nr:ABC transporter ATP-binding protein [Psychromarinibacter halotolerans]MDF0595564.1 ABC transporter ATP-binding protein [Psychromarinibacter halotolerans]